MDRVDDLRRRIASLRTDVEKWRAGRPLQRFLRTCDVITWLSAAGIVLSVGALMVLIGLGETQIAASEGQTPNLFGRTLF
jgi:hypothetical protein